MNNDGGQAIARFFKRSLLRLDNRAGSFWSGGRVLAWALVDCGANAVAEGTTGARYPMETLSGVVGVVLILDAFVV